MFDGLLVPLRGSSLLDIFAVRPCVGETHVVCIVLASLDHTFVGTLVIDLDQYKELQYAKS